MKTNKSFPKTHSSYGNSLTGVNQISKMFTASLLVIVMVVAGGIVACNKSDKDIAPTAEKPDAAMAKFVEDFYKNASDEEVNAIVKQYEALSPGELHQFWVLKNERDMKAYEAMSFAGKSNVSEAEKNLVRERSKAIVDFRMSLLTASQERFGQPMNKISPEQFNTLSNDIMKNKKYDILNENLNTAAKESGVLACATAYWGAYATEISFTGGIGYYGMWRIDNDPDTPATVCDREYRFDGDYRYIRGENAPSSLAINNLSKRSIYYSTGVDTGVLLGHNTWIALLYPYELHARMKN